MPIHKSGKQNHIPIDELRKLTTSELTGEDKLEQLEKLIIQVEAHPDYPEAERLTTLKHLRDIAKRLAKMLGVFTDRASQKEMVKNSNSPNPMQQGEVGLFKNEVGGVAYFNIRSGDNGLPFEDILPETMRGEGFADAPISAYINQLYIWLSSIERWNAAQESITPELEKVKGTGKKVSFLPPVLDVDDLELLTADGSIDYLRLRDLCLLVAPYWDKGAHPGLIVGAIKVGSTINDMSLMLKKMAPLLDEGKSSKQILDDLNNCPDVKAANLFLPSDYHQNSSGYPAPEEALKYTEQWVRSTSLNAAITKSKLAWQTDMRQLGILSSKGKLDETRARLITNYIWSRQGETPSFLKLLKWLRDEMDYHKREGEEQLARAHTGQQAAARKKAKAARKRAKKTRRK